MAILPEDPKFMSRRDARELRIKGDKAAKKIYGEDWRDHIPEPDIVIKHFFWDYVMTPREKILLERLIRQAESFCLYGDEAKELRVKARDAAYKLYGGNWGKHIPNDRFWDYEMSPTERLTLENIIEKADAKYPDGRHCLEEIVEKANGNAVLGGE